MAGGRKGRIAIDGAGRREDASRDWRTPLFETWRRQGEWLLQQQMTLAAVPAPTGNESARAAALQQRLAAAAVRTDGAMTIATDAAGNIDAVIAPACGPAGDGAADAAPLVCLAHLDSVYPPEPGAPLQVEREGAQLRCPGIGDNGRGLAALLALGHLLSASAVRAKLRRAVHLVATVGEEGEGNLRGARAWFDAAAQAGRTPCAAVAIDGPGDESIVHHAVGSRRIRVHLTGPGGHSWTHGDAPNPLHALGRFIARLDLLRDQLVRRGVERTSLNVTRLFGGESLTALPREGWVDVDLRSSSEATLARVQHDLERLARQCADGFSLRLVPLGDRPAGHLDSAHPLVRTAMRATEAIGRTPRSAMASTDANIPLSRGIPAIAIGAGGRGGRAHTADEWYDDTDSGAGLERVFRVVLDLATT